MKLDSTATASEFIEVSLLKIGLPNLLRNQVFEVRQIPNLASQFASPFFSTRKELCLTAMTWPFREFPAPQNATNTETKGTLGKRSRNAKAHESKTWNSWAFDRAERGGFEPPVGLKPYTDLANRRIRPLCHLSDPRADGRNYTGLKTESNFGDSGSERAARRDLSFTSPTMTNRCGTGDADRIRHTDGRANV